MANTTTNFTFNEIKDIIKDFTRMFKDYTNEDLIYEVNQLHLHYGWSEWNNEIRWGDHLIKLSEDTESCISICARCTDGLNYYTASAEEEPWQHIDIFCRAVAALRVLNKEIILHRDDDGLSELNKELGTNYMNWYQAALHADKIGTAKIYKYKKGFLNEWSTLREVMMPRLASFNRIYKDKLDVFALFNI